MTGLRVIRAILRNLWIIILFPLLMGITVFYLTRNENKIYDSKMTIYTGISAAKLGIGDGGGKLDFFTANNSMDNLIALLKGRNTIQDAAVKLLALHLSLPKHNPRYLSWESFKGLNELIPDSIRRTVAVINNPLMTEIKIREHLISNPNGLLSDIMMENPHYGIDVILEKVKAVRRASSDMIDISYESDDAAICMLTLRYLAEAYFKRYKEMKRAQNLSAVEYFEAQLREAYAKLRISEDQLKAFISENKILNYYEQGKTLANYEKEEEQEEQDVRQRAKGADKALTAIEEQLFGNMNRKGTVDSLAYLRQNITLTRQKLNAMLLNKMEYAAEIEKARRDIQKDYDAISRQVSSLYNQDYSIQGIPVSNVLTEWLNLFTDREKQLSYLELVAASKNMVSKRVEEFAPLGAELKRLERGVDVNESQYLSILHGLNMANLQRQSVEQASVQELVDEPYLPRDARKSKRLLLVIAAGFAGTVIVLGTIIARVILDNSLLNAENAAAITGLRVIASFPEIAHSKKAVRLEETSKMAGNQLMNEVLVAYSKKEITNKPYRVAIYETMKSDKAPLLTKQLSHHLNQLPYDTIDYFPDENLDGKGLPYEGNAPSLATKKWEDFKVRSQTEDQFILLTFPPLNHALFPTHLIKEADLILVSVSAKRQWKQVDKQVLEMMQTCRGSKPVMVLQDVDTDQLKDYFGFVPSKSWLGRNRNKYR